MLSQKKKKELCSEKVSLALDTIQLDYQFYLSYVLVDLTQSYLGHFKITFSWKSSSREIDFFCS